jgi:hypothetical protein
MSVSVSKWDKGAHQFVGGIGGRFNELRQSDIWKPDQEQTKYRGNKLIGHVVAVVSLLRDAGMIML